MSIKRILWRFVAKQFPSTSRIARDIRLAKAGIKIIEDSPTRQDLQVTKLTSKPILGAEELSISGEDLRIRAVEANCVFSMEEGDLMLGVHGDGRDIPNSLNDKQIFLTGTVVRFESVMPPYEESPDHIPVLYRAMGSWRFRFVPLERSFLGSNNVLPYLPESK